MGYNPVFDSCVSLMNHSRYIDISNTEEAIDKTAQLVVDNTKRFGLPPWNFPPYHPSTNTDTIPMFLFGNAFNFCYIDQEKSQEKGEIVKFTKRMNGDTYVGSDALWSSVRIAYSKYGSKLFHGDFLESMSDEQIEEMFSGTVPIPMLDERKEIVWELGRVLNEYYGGRFEKLVDASRNKEGMVILYGNGSGLVDRLVGHFPSFIDEVVFDGETVYFDKRAQLAPAMLAGRYASLPEAFPDRKDFQVADLDQITVFADYNLPRPLIKTGAIKVDKDVMEDLENSVEFPANSRRLAEIRAATIVQWRAVRKAVETITGLNLTDAHIDGAGFLMTRKMEGLPNPLYSRTTAF